MPVNPINTGYSGGEKDNIPLNEIICSDALEALKSLSTCSVHCCITSPPYWNKRDYKTGKWEGGDSTCDHVRSEIRRGLRLNESVHSTRGGGWKASKVNPVQFGQTCGKCGAVRVDEQIGLEEDPSQYFSNLADIFDEVRRVLRDDGTLWIVIGDTYAANRSYQVSPTKWGNLEYGEGNRGRVPNGVKPLDLIGVPYLLALELRARGWYWRGAYIWNKPNCFPESVTSRCTTAHETILHMAKSPKYYHDADAVREPHSNSHHDGGRHEYNTKPTMGAGGEKGVAVGNHPGGRNRRSVWNVALKPTPYEDKHFAPYPEKLVEPMVLMATPPQACSSCGSPHLRLTERETRLEANVAKAGNVPKGKYEGIDQAATGKYDVRMGPVPVVRTIGWEPSCNCGDSATVPAVVLDPFLGTGTTAAVAKAMGRDYLGIELNEEYVKLARRRVLDAQPSLFSQLDLR